jgi:hypothetical protein
VANPTPPLASNEANQILQVLKTAEDRPADLANKILFSLRQDLEWKVSEEYVQEKLLLIGDTILKGRESDAWAVAQLNALLVEKPVDWEVLVPIRSPECLDLRGSPSGSVSLFNCELVAKPPDSLLAQAKAERSAPGVYSYIVRKERQAFVLTSIKALQGDSYQAARVGARKADVGLAALRATVREAWDAAVEPPAIEIAEQSIYIRLKREEDPDLGRWQICDLIRTQPISMSPMKLGATAQPNIATLLSAATRRYIEGEKLSEVVDRILGAFFLLNEAGKEHTLMNRFLRLVCSLEHLTSYDSVGRARITLWFSLRGMLLSLSAIPDGSLPTAALQSRLQKLARLFKEYRRYPKSVSLSEILRGAYEARSALSHQWAPGVAGAWYVKRYVDVLYCVVRGAISTLLTLNSDFDIKTDEELTLLFATCFQVLLLLSSATTNDEKLEIKNLAFAYPKGVLGTDKSRLGKERWKHVLDGAVFLLVRSKLCENTGNGYLCATWEGLVLGHDLHHNFELHYRRS